MFVGYHEGVKGYKVWYKITHKCIINRDVTFYEEVIINDKDTAVFDMSPYTNELIKEITIVKDSKIEVKSSSSSDNEVQDKDVIKGFQERSEVDELRASEIDLQNYQLAKDKIRLKDLPNMHMLG